MELLDAIYRRKSIRKYSGNKLQNSVLTEIRNIAGHLQPLYRQIDTEIHIVEDGERIHEISSGIIGSYGKIRAPHYLVYTSDDKEGYLENAGFILEQAVLQLTVKNIGTCWIGGYIKKQLLKDIIKIKKGQKPVIVIAFGYPEASGDLARTFTGGAKRRKLSKLLTGNPDEVWTRILDAARLAPSTVNGQPWRFIMEKGAVHLFIVKKPGILARHLGELNRIDAGIALAHIHTAAEHYSRPIAFETLPSMERKGHIYITSILEIQDKL